MIYKDHEYIRKIEKSNRWNYIEIIRGVITVTIMVLIYRFKISCKNEYLCELISICKSK